MAQTWPESAPCPTCGARVDETRAADTNYMVNIAAGEPGGPTDWYPCGGCLSILAVEWIAVKSIGDDGWGITPTGVILLPGAAVAHVIERLRAALADGDAQSAWEELITHPHSKWLVKTPEVIAAAVTGLRGSAVAARDLEASICSRSDYASAKRSLGKSWFVSRYVHIAELDDATSAESVALLKRSPAGDGDVLIPTSGALHATAVFRKNAKLRVHGSLGPFALVTPASELYESNGDNPLRVTLDRLAPDPHSP